MTIKYALTRAEIVRAFLVGLSRSPRLLLIVMALSFWPGIVWLATKGAFARSFGIGDALAALEWAIGAFCFLVLWVFIRAKTSERTLSASEEGLSTTIGSLNGKVPWAKVKNVVDAGRYILIVGRSGNAFFIPTRAFSGSDQRTQFLSEIEGWRSTS
jgi:hypothetical protein